MQGGFTLGELFAAAVTTLDIFVIYILLQVKGRKIILALWTAFLNMLLPLIGFILGEFSTLIFADWSMLLSGVLLGLIGLHMLLEDADEPAKLLNVHPFFIALLVSLDAFSVSVSFGMLQMNKFLFVVASGIFSLFFSLVALYFQKKLSVKSSRGIRQFAGASLIIIGILSWIY